MTLDASALRNQRFVAFNCAAIPGALWGTNCSATKEARSPSGATCGWWRRNTKLQRIFLTPGCNIRLVASLPISVCSGCQDWTCRPKLNADHRPIPTIFITAHGDETIRLRAMRGAR
jgi:hypothetical protein